LQVHSKLQQKISEVKKIEAECVKLLETLGETKVSVDRIQAYLKLLHTIKSVNVTTDSIT